MEDKIFTRVKGLWNRFINGGNNYYYYQNDGPGSSSRPDRPRRNHSNERSIINSIYNRIAIDAASVDMLHIRVDDQGRYQEDMPSGLNNCLTLDANLDQTGRAFLQDVVMSLLDDGSVAIVPIDTTDDPENSSSYDILSLRVGKILEWYPMKVKVRVYDERSGKMMETLVSKKNVAIIENPLYAIMNEPNSTLQRLIRKLNLLDVIDEQSGSGKLDIIIQVPYAIKTQTRIDQAESRRKSIEDQLSNTKYGIAYADATEKIIQLNRPVENNLMAQIKFLTEMVYAQLGMSQSILDGSADTKTNLSYLNRIVEPILSPIRDEMKRKFLTKTARTQGQSIAYFRDPFRMMPVELIADMADKLTRNEIATSNEIRGKIGLKPAKDPGADELRNKNLNQPKVGETPSSDNPSANTKEGGEPSGEV